MFLLRSATVRTLQRLDESGLDLRVWCFRCARGERVDSLIWRRFAAKGWPLDIPTAAARFRCRCCGRSDEVAIYPTRRPPPSPNAPAELVAAFFHGMRGQAKRRRRDAERGECPIARAIAARVRKETGAAAVKPGAREGEGEGD